jgi:glycosyltransferase involved in cell wall biosynthesis
MTENKISIIIPTHNEQENLPILLNSIIKQNTKNLEIIIADNNSTDKTLEIASAYGCRIVDGGFPAEGRNNGAKYSFGNLFVFKDGDSPLPDNFLNPALKEFNERKLDVAGTLQYPLSTKNGFTALRHRLYLEFFTNKSLLKAQNTSNPLLMHCIFVKRKVHETIGGFDEELEFGEDSNYAKRAKKAGYNFGILQSCGKVGMNMRRFEEKEFKTLLKNFYFNAVRTFGHEFKKDSRIKYW